VRLAQLVLDRFGVTARLIPGSGGVFDIVADGKKIFSKHDEGRFPDEDDVLDELAEL
jgi:selenoprotein W-related protein